MENTTKQTTESTLEWRARRIAERAVSGRWPVGQIEFEICELIAQAISEARTDVDFRFDR